jgi:hypothetical protein
MKKFVLVSRLEDILFQRKKEGKPHTHQWIADQLNANYGYKVTRQTVSAWVKGVNEPPLSKAFALAELLEVSVYDLHERKYID